MWLFDTSDDSVLADRGSASTSDGHDTHGWIAFDGFDVDQGRGRQLPELYQLHVLRRIGDGHCCGALWSASEGGSQNY